MCGRYTITSPPDAMRETFGYAEQPNFPPRYNIAPTQPVPIVRRAGEGRQFALVRWGLVPSWAKGLTDIPLLINARGETVLTKPSFRNAIRRRRCLFPADGFYEWKKGKGDVRVPYYISQADRGLMAFAGIWECWSVGDGGELETAAIITTEANEPLRPIHHRMPVILKSEDHDDWLDTERVDANDAVHMLRPAPDDWLEARRVSARVNRVANDDAKLLEPVGDEGPVDDKPARSESDQLDLL